MKRFFTAIVFLILLVACDKDTPRNNNPYLPSYNFSATLNLNLPLYSNLNSNLNATPVTVDGDIDVVIMKVGGTDFRAWNGNCPNHAPTGCSRLSASGITAKCNCEDGFTYSAFTGIGSTGSRYNMIPYHVQVIDNSTIRVYN